CWSESDFNPVPFFGELQNEQCPPEAGGPLGSGGEKNRPRRTPGCEEATPSALHSDAARGSATWNSVAPISCAVAARAEFRRKRIVSAPPHAACARDNNQRKEKRDERQHEHRTAVGAKDAHRSRGRTRHAHRDRRRRSGHGP